MSVCFPVAPVPAANHTLIPVFVVLPISMCVIILGFLFLVQRWRKDKKKKRPWTTDHPINLGSPSRYVAGKI